MSFAFCISGWIFPSASYNRRHTRSPPVADALIFVCPSAKALCGGRLRLIALIEEAVVIDRILRHLGVPTEIPSPRPARARPLCAATSDQAGWDDASSMFMSSC